MAYFFSSVVVGLGATLLTIGNTPAHASDPVFTDQTISSNLNAENDPSVWIVLSPINVSSMLGGGAVGDFNNDGFQDIFVIVGGGSADKLFINNGDGTFTESAAQWGVDYSHMGVGSAVGDYDNDGWLDIFITSLGPAIAPTQPGFHLLYHNNADGSFTNVAAAAGVNMTSTDVADGFGAVFGDYDLDGDLDLVVVGWVLESGCNRLFENNGDGTFTDKTAEANLNGLSGVHGFSPALVDMNGDRYPELLIAADFSTSRYLLNNGDGSFTDITADNGTGLDANGMGSTIGDFDNDQFLDWYVTSIYSPKSHLPNVPGTGNMLYMGQGKDFFVENSIPASVNDGGWGWGTVAVDINHDQLLDIVETNGWSESNGPAGPEWANETTYVFLNIGGGKFSDVTALCGFDHTGQGRGLTNLDYDNDGDQDIVIFANDEPVMLYRNDLTGPDTNWIRIFLDTSSDSTIAPNGIGSLVTVSANGQTQRRTVAASNNYLVQSELSAHFGLADAPIIEEINVTWPNGKVTILKDVEVNQILTITPILPQMPGDLDGDGSVGVSDLLILLGNWGPCPDCNDCIADLDDDCAVGVIDLLILLGNWG